MLQVSALEAENKSTLRTVETAAQETDQKKDNSETTSPPQTVQRSEGERLKEKEEHDALLDMMG